ncbi:septum formation protein [Microthyrium microscopicum]|uniref:Septum formation protein n=1 Tax=Microthyrium microscopicum TaxID=703497 RepID=A0A6A6UB30_9PEZI|nr:septum formation protein [Microthyrium microscopicum]
MPDTKNSTPLDPPPSYEAAQQPSAPVLRPRAPVLLDLPALNSLRGKRVILASASPRRRQLLAQIGLTNLEIIPSAFAEDLPKSGAPFDYVLETATQKALKVYEQEINNVAKGEPTLIIAADTIVVAPNGEILEKPKSMKSHVETLQMLRDGGFHQVYTAVACMAPLESAADPGYRLETHVEETAVRFDPLATDELILSYVKTREGVDKAGGYGIQGIGAILIDKIDGSFDNVVGLPLKSTLKLIEKIMTQQADDEEELNFDR